MTQASNEIDEHLLSLAWSLWAELGVSSVVRDHQDCCVDPEALLIFTAALADADPRLRDESLDCALAIAPYLWTSRLKTLLTKSDEESRRAFGQYAATFNRASTSHVELPFANDRSALDLRRSGKSRPDEHAGSPAQLLLRCRAIFGVGARADATCVIVFAQQQGWLATEMSTHVGLPKRAMATVLRDFAFAGVLTPTQIGNRVRYDLARRQALSQLVGALPRFKPLWSLILPFLLSMRSIINHSETRGPMTSLVDANKQIRAFLKTNSVLGLHRAAPDVRSWDSVERWFVSLLAEVCSGDTEWFGERTESIPALQARSARRR